MEALVTCPFESDLVLEDYIGDARLRAFSVGFEQNKFRLEPLVDVIRKVIPEFALGYHAGAQIPIEHLVEKLREAATRVYTTEKYKTRGEFGELILHLLLRDFFGSIPLISKIYFKDTDNAAVHGFDGVHIVVNGGDKSLWLGESKLYANGAAGVKELASDVAAHLERDYLRREFSLISTKLPHDIPDIEYWRRLLHGHRRLEEVLDRISIPVICTYSSRLFENFNDVTAEYKKAFIDECVSLNEIFKGKNVRTDVDVILILLPVPDKQELITSLDKRLKYMQSI
jgi:hypothetical protein